MELRIFQKGFNFSQDGPGNRLVYHLQGCNLHCPWCSNPEGLPIKGGTSYSVAELVSEAQRSSLLFFDGGGVTLTGGEIAMQLDAVKELLTGLRAQSIHTCIETNGTSPRLPELFDVLDLLIMDIKHYDPDKHRAVTGVSCSQTFANLSAALKVKQPMQLRIPLIGGFNASLEDAEGFVRLFDSLGLQKRATVELLPYHEYGRVKYEQLGLPYPMDERAHISPQALQAFRSVLEQGGVSFIHT